MSPTAGVLLGPAVIRQAARRTHTSVHANVTRSARALACRAVRGGGWMCYCTGRRYNHFERVWPAKLVHKGKGSSRRRPSGPGGIGVHVLRGWRIRIRMHAPLTSLRVFPQTPTCADGGRMTNGSVATAAQYSPALRAVGYRGSVRTSHRPHHRRRLMTRALTHTIGVQVSAALLNHALPRPMGPRGRGQTESTCVSDVHASPSRTATPLPAVPFRGASSPVMHKMPLLKRRITATAALWYTLGRPIDLRRSAIRPRRL